MSGASLKEKLHNLPLDVVKHLISHDLQGEDSTIKAHTNVSLFAKGYGSFAQKHKEDTKSINIDEFQTSWEFGNAICGSPDMEVFIIQKVVAAVPTPRVSLAGPLSTNISMIMNGRKT
jgi:hypothetical protein